MLLKQPGIKVDQSPRSGEKLRISGVYLHSRIRFQGVRGEKFTLEINKLIHNSPKPSDLSEI